MAWEQHYLHGLINRLFATRHSSRKTLYIAMKSHDFDYIDLSPQFRHLPIIWFTFFIWPIQYRWVRSRTSTEADGWMCIVGPSSHADQLRRTGSISSWFGMWLLHQINVWNLARRTCCLKASSVEGSIVAVCCHGHGVAHSLSVSTSLSFFPREYAEAFKELCNSESKGTLELGNARSNKNRRGVQDVKD